MMPQLFDALKAWTLGGTLVLSLAFFAVILGRRWLSPRMRHGLLLAGFTAFALLPLAKWVLPNVRTVPIAFHIPAPKALPAVPTVRNTLPTQPAATPWWQVLSIEDGLLALWAIGACFGIFGLFRSLVMVRRLAKEGERLEDGPIADQVATLALALNLKRDVSLLFSSRIQVPQAWGPPHAMVILPVSARTWPVHRLRMVLAHELAHCKRRDSLTHCLLRAVLALQWFNPIARYACKRAELEQEMATDALALHCGLNAGAYSAELLDLARQFNVKRLGNATSPALLAKSGLRQRVESLMFGRKHAASGLVAILAAMPGLLGFLSLTMVETRVRIVVPEGMVTAGRDHRRNRVPEVIGANESRMPGDAEASIRDLLNKKRASTGQTQQALAGQANEPPESEADSIVFLPLQSAQDQTEPKSANAWTVSRPPWPGESEAPPPTRQSAHEQDAAKSADVRLGENLLAPNQGFRSLFNLPDQFVQKLSLSEWLNNQNPDSISDQQIITKKRQIIKVIKR